MRGATRAARALAILCAAVAPLVVVYVGVHALALHLESLQPDGDLEAGGSFAVAVLAAELVIVSYVVAGLLLLGLWRWVGHSPLSALVVVLTSSVAVTAVGVAFDWQ